MPRIAWTLALSLCAAPAFADNPQEQALRAHFEGKTVTVGMDMPATHKGVDLKFDREQPMDFKEHSERIRDFDVAIREGERATITQLKLKDDMIELHLSGGGFNWFLQGSTKVFLPQGKSSREKDLEKQLKSETERGRRKRLENELDDLRQDRERRDDRERRAVEAYNLAARERDHDRALRAGSRFNLRFKKRVPALVLTPEGLKETLSPWVDFGDGRRRGGGAERREERIEDRIDERRDDRRGGSSRIGADDELRKGMTYDEVERLLGRPTRRERCDGGEVGCEVVVFDGRDGEIEATFVEDVLVRFSRRQS